MVSRVSVAPRASVMTPSMSYAKPSGEILELTADNIDAVIDGLDEAYMKMEDAAGNNVVRTKVELDLLVKIEKCRDMLLAAMKKGHNDRTALKDVFGGDCWRIEWIVTLLENLELSPMHASDQRPGTCLNACHSVEQVLVDLGYAEKLKEAHARAAQSRLNKDGRMVRRASQEAIEAPVEEETQAPETTTSMSGSVHREDDVPSVLSGLLWKKSPNPLKLHKFQRRYVEVREAKLLWWYPDVDRESEPKGCLDFRVNPCVVDTESKEGRFSVKPKDGTWKSGDFTGAHKGREFQFDASDSEAGLQKWIEALQAHILYGEGKFGSRISYKW